MERNWKSGSKPNTFDEGDKKIEWEKNSLFNKLCWTGYLHTKKYYAGLLLHIVYEN